MYVIYMYTHAIIQIVKMFIYVFTMSAFFVSVLLNQIVDGSVLKHIHGHMLICAYTDTHKYAYARSHIYIYSYIHIYTYIHTYIFVDVNFDALAQASDIQIERRQVAFLC